MKNFLLDWAKVWKAKAEKACWELATNVSYRKKKKILQPY